MVAINKQWISVSTARGSHKAPAPFTKMGSGALWQPSSRTNLIFILSSALSIKNHWMNEDIPWSRCCKVKSLFNDWIFTQWTRRLLAQWLNFRSLNKEFTLQHCDQGISSFIQWFFFESVPNHPLSTIVIQITIYPLSADWGYCNLSIWRNKPDPNQPAEGRL